MRATGRRRIMRKARASRSGRPYREDRAVASRLNPYIAFNGDARQAMEFYKEVFGGELALNTFGSADGGGAPAGFEDKIMHAMLETPAGYTIMASDTPPGMPHTPGTTISVSLSGDDADALH